MDIKDLEGFNLTEEQKQKVLNLDSREEVDAFIESEGIELTDEQLEAVAGGNIWTCCAVKDCGCDDDS